MRIGLALAAAASLAVTVFTATSAAPNTCPPGTRPVEVRRVMTCVPNELPPIMPECDFAPCPPTAAPRH